MGIKTEILKKEDDHIAIDITPRLDIVHLAIFE